LARKINDEQAKVFVEKAKLQAEKINSLISDILDVSKIEAGKLVIKLERFNIRQLLENTIEMVAHANTDFTITLHTAVDALDMIGNIQRIEQVLVNLLTNAIRYSTGSDKIMVYLNQEGNKVKVGVKDYG
jgi:signal transduction histidine kinase